MDGYIISNYCRSVVSRKDKLPFVCLLSVQIHFLTTKTPTILNHEVKWVEDQPDCSHWLSVSVSLNRVCRYLAR